MWCLFIKSDFQKCQEGVDSCWVWGRALYLECPSTFVTRLGFHPTSNQKWGMWLCCGDFQLHVQFWRLDWIRNSFIWLAIANHEDCHFRFQNRSFMRCKLNKRSKWRFSFSQCDLPQALPIVLISEPRMVSIFLSTLSNGIVIAVILVSVLNYKPSHTQLKYSCPFKKTHHIRLTYLRFWTFELNHLHCRWTTLANTSRPVIYLGSASTFWEAHVFRHIPTHVIRGSIICPECVGKLEKRVTRCHQSLGLVVIAGVW